MIFLLGGSGYIGQAFQRHFIRHGIAHRAIRRAELDYSDPARLLAALRAERPRFLINASGYTGKPNVDACELHRAECLFGNAVLPARIAEACASAGVPWGNLSSGCIYEGAKPDGSGFTELDPPNFPSATARAHFTAAPRRSGRKSSPAIPTSTSGASASPSTTSITHATT